MFYKIIINIILIVQLKMFDKEFLVFNHCVIRQQKTLSRQICQIWEEIRNTLNKKTR